MLRPPPNVPHEATTGSAIPSDAVSSIPHGCQTNSSYSPNPRVKPQDHRRHRQFGHRRSENASHSINSINTFSNMAANNRTTKPMIITNGMITSFHHPNPGALSAIGESDAVSISERPKRMAGTNTALRTPVWAKNPAQTPNWANRSMPYVTVGRNPRASL